MPLGGQNVKEIQFKCIGTPKGNCVMWMVVYVFVEETAQQSQNTFFATQSKCYDSVDLLRPSHCSLVLSTPYGPKCKTCRGNRN